MTSSRIVTLTVNPALDLAAEAVSVRPVHKIRTFGEHYDAGAVGSMWPAWFTSWAATPSRCSRRVARPDG